MYMSGQNWSNKKVFNFDLNKFKRFQSQNDSEKLKQNYNKLKVKTKRYTGEKHKLLPNNF